jgi:hypothetical protein
MNRSNSLGIPPSIGPGVEVAVPVGFRGVRAPRRLDQTGLARVVHLLTGHRMDAGSLAALHRRTGGEPRRVLVHLLVTLCDDEPRRDAPGGASWADDCALAQPTEAVFRREADFWLIAYGGTSVRLRDSRGLGYLGALLHRPGREIDAVDLVADGGLEARRAARDESMRVHRTVDDDLAPIADAKALSAYRRRLVEVRSEMAEAELANDLASMDRLRNEGDALQNTLIEAVRRRRTGTHRERARLTVTKGIGAAIARIAARHPALAVHLRVTVRRGYVCAYQPDPRHPLAWQG